MKTNLNRFLHPCFHSMAYNFINNVKSALSAAFVLMLMMLAVSCSSDDDDIIKPTPEPEAELVPAVTTNPAKYITDSAKLAMLHNIYDLNGDGSIYEMHYTADYKLDQVIDCGIAETNQLFRYIGSILYDDLSPSSAKATYGAGCSAFAVPDASTGNFLMGRNYDFRHANKDGTSYVDISAIVVHTAPAGGKKSISIVDGLNLGYGKGFYTDGTTDLSLLMGMPYAALDGINEDGFAIGILALKENQTNQQTGKKRISSTVAIRMLLDRASTVKEAVSMLQNYDMDMRGQGSRNYHFFMADATGDYAIVEYTRAEGDTIPTVMEVFSGNDTLRCVTNFYVSPTMVGTTDGWGSDHGKDRYWNMRNTLLSNNYALRTEDAWSLLELVSQPPTEEITSQTQWSSLYNLSEKTLRLSILRNFAKQYNFKVE